MSYRRKEVIGDATLYLGDCLEVLPMLDKVDAVVTDPPFGANIAYASFDDTRENVDALVSSAFPLMHSIANVVCVTPGIKNIGLYPEPDWILCHMNPAGERSGPWGFACWIPALVYGDDPYLHSGQGRRPDARSKFPGNYDPPEHPCPKHPSVWSWFVERVSLPEQVILDPFMGSGTTGVSCIRLGRRFIGCELEPKYFDIACRRISEAWGKGSLFEDKTPVPELFTEA